MKTCITFLLLTLTVQLMSQSSDTTFFPSFEPYSEEPIIHFGDEIEGSPWNDPTILKEGDQYIMYVVGVEGGLNHPNDTISVYRWLSDDGYSWDLNPELPVLEAVENTYYGGGVETPSVVFFNNEYHMYNSVYTENNPYLFKISHATSPDGINWEIDDAPVLEPAEDLTWMNTIVAEPGVMVKQDTLYLFYTAAGTVGNQSIGLVRSNDGHTFTDTTQVVTLPTDVYPEDGNYAGLSTPSPLLLGDTIYLFTDVAQYVFGDNWMQVALHQFKSYGNLTQWYHDSEPIHTRNDFPWTNGNYLAEIRSITPLMDGDNLRIWYSGHNISEIDTLTNDTTNHVFFIGDELHVNYGNWGIGTSEYLFDTSSSLTENKNDDPGIKIS
ncbi:MAG: hypothetical protein ACPGWM_06600, partial [Flavobacteriales bacterium]